MPIYEFYCSACHRVFRFLSRKVDTQTRPACPRCGRPRLERRPSSFAVTVGRSEPDAGGEIDDAALDRAVASLAGEVDGLDDSDPRHAAHVLRKVYEASGLPVTGAMQEAIRRMEAGEDPDRIEDELGSALDDADPVGGDPGRPGRVRALARKLVPPSIDESLHEL